MKSIMRAQEGATLIVGLIMLVLLTLMAVTSFTLGKGNLQVVGNMQYQNETQRAAEEFIERVISSPTAVTQITTGTVDVNGDGIPDVTVTVTPKLVKAYVKLNKDIVLTDAAQVGCTLGAAQTFGVEGASTGVSLCGCRV